MTTTATPLTLADKSRLALAGAGYVPLTADEEKTLCERIRRGDQDATWTLVLCNHNFVRSVAQRYLRDDLALEDLVAEGVLGLVEAAERFDADRGIKFITYGIWWIKRAILRHLRTFEHAVHVPKYKHYQLHEFRRTVQRLAQELGRHPTAAELCAATGGSAHDVAELMALASGPDALDADVEGAGFSPEALGPSPEDAVLAQDSRERLLSVLPLLPERERRIIGERYGLGGEDAATLAEIGERVGLTKERVRQIEVDARGKLKAAMTTPRRPRRGRREAAGAPLRAA